jgi:hypothetical protein
VLISPVTKYTPPVNNDIKGLIDSVNDGSTSAFMWEWFTTKPWLDSGEVRFVRTPTEKTSQYLLKFTSSDRLCPHTVAVVVNRRTPLPRARPKRGRSHLPKLAHQLRYRVRFSGKQGIHQCPLHPEDLGISRGRYKGVTIRTCRFHAVLY